MKNVIRTLLVISTALLFTAPVWGAETVRVRSAEHPAFSRMVFDFEDSVDYRIIRRGGELAISFARPAEFLLGSLASSGLQHFSRPDIRQTDAGVSLIVRIQENVPVHHFRDGTKVAVDVYAPGANPVAGTPVAVSDGPVGQAATEETAIPDEMPTQTGAEQKPASGPAPASPDTDQETTTDPLQEKKADPVKEAAGGREEEREAAEIQPDPAAMDQAAASTPSVPGDTFLSIQTEGDTQTLTFNWNRPVAAAVFERAGILWIVFDDPAKVNLSRLQPHYNVWFEEARILDDPDYFALLLELRDSPPVAVLRDDQAWTIKLGGATGIGELALARQEESGGPRVFIPADGPGLVLDIRDPYVGDLLTIVPLRQAGLGFPAARDFAEFQVLKSVQGLAVERISDTMLVTRYSNGVGITGLDRLAISDSPLRADMGMDGGGGKLRLIDLDDWKLTGKQEFQDMRLALTREAALAQGEEKREARWRLSRFLLAHGLAPEAGGVLEAMVKDEPDLAGDPRLAALRGVIALKTGRPADAVAAFAHPALDAEADIPLWRTLAYLGTGDSAAALEAFLRGREGVEFFAPAQQADFRLAAAEAAINLERYDTAAWELSLAREAAARPGQRVRADYLEGRLKAGLGETDAAISLWYALEEKHNRRAYAEGTLARVEAQLSRGDLSREEAIRELEHLRFGWRGDPLQLRLYSRIGDLYAAEGQPRAALETWRTAVSEHAGTEAARALTADMRALFRNLFLAEDGRAPADDMNPVTALALYQDFRELTPLGAEGDAIIRRLSDRLVAMDLLAQAAELLDYQVRFRLEGVPQSIIAADLAKVYLMDGRADNALGALRLTRHNDLPADALRERTLVEARALTELGRFEEAEVILEPYTGQDVLALRADIHWGARNWAALGTVTARLMQGRHEDDTPLAATERQRLIRHVIAYAMLGDVAGLRRLRTQYAMHMQDGRFSNAFQMITAAEDVASREVIEVVRQTAAVDSFQAFMDAYRNDFTRSES